MNRLLVWEWLTRERRGIHVEWRVGIYLLFAYCVIGVPQVYTWPVPYDGYEAMRARRYEMLREQNRELRRPHPWTLHLSDEDAKRWERLIGDAMDRRNRLTVKK